MAGPAILTYSSLITDAQSYFERPNDARLLAQLPRLVMLAENRVATALRILGLQKVVTAAFTAADPVVAKPALWRRTVSFRYQTAAGRYVDLKLRTYEFCRHYWPVPANVTANPVYYSDYNFDNFLIAGTPSLASPFELVYIAKVEPLSDTVQGNWLTANAPQLLLKAVLLEGEIFLKNIPRIDSRKGEYDEAVAAFKSEDGSRAVDRNVVLS